MVLDNPLFGVGLGQFIPQEDRYDRNLIDLAGKPFIAHNTYIQIGAEQGLIVLALFMVIMVLAIRNCRFVERANPSPRIVSMAVAIRIGLLGFAVAAFFVSAPYMVFYWMLIFVSQNVREVAMTQMAVEEESTVHPGLLRNTAVAANA